MNASRRRALASNVVRFVPKSSLLLLVEHGYAEDPLHFANACRWPVSVAERAIRRLRPPTPAPNLARPGGPR